MVALVARESRGDVMTEKKNFKIRDGAADPDKPGLLKQRQEHDEKRDVYLASQDPSMGNGGDNGHDERADMPTAMEMALEMIKSEPLNDLEYTLWDGRVIQMYAPLRSIAMTVERMVSSSQDLVQSPLARNLIAATMYVQTIDGEQIKMPTSLQEVYKLQDVIGDRALSEVTVLYQKHFITAPNLSLTKKNIRVR